MQVSQYKIFKDTNKNILILENNMNDYYTFVSEQVNQGLLQMILLSNSMLNILSNFVSEKNAKIVEMKFMEEELDELTSIKATIVRVNEDKAQLYNLIAELNVIANQETTEIKSIRVKYRNSARKLVDITISINGVISISKNEATIEGLEFLENILRKSVVQ